MMNTRKKKPYIFIHSKAIIHTQFCSGFHANKVAEQLEREMNFDRGSVGVVEDLDY